MLFPWLRESSASAFSEYHWIHDPSFVTVYKALSCSSALPITFTWLKLSAVCWTSWDILPMHLLSASSHSSVSSTTVRLLSFCSPLYLLFPDQSLADSICSAVVVSQQRGTDTRGAQQSWLCRLPLRDLDMLKTFAPHFCFVCLLFGFVFNWD